MSTCVFSKIWGRCDFVWLWGQSVCGWRMKTHAHLSEGIFTCAPTNKRSLQSRWLRLTWAKVKSFCQTRTKWHTVAYTHILPQWHHLNQSRVVSALCLFLFIWYDKQLDDSYMAANIIKRITVGFLWVFMLCVCVCGCRHKQIPSQSSLCVCLCVSMCDSFIEQYFSGWRNTCGILYECLSWVLCTAALVKCSSIYSVVMLKHKTQKWPSRVYVLFNYLASYLAPFVAFSQWFIMTFHYYYHYGTIYQLTLQQVHICKLI